MSVAKGVASQSWLIVKTAFEYSPKAWQKAGAYAPQIKIFPIQENTYNKIHLT